VWLVVLAGGRLGAGAAGLAAPAPPTDQVDAAVLRQFARVRPGWLTASAYDRVARQDGRPWP
jgi:hypothetical protein